MKVLRRDCDGEEIEAPDAALALIARSARGSFRDAESTLDQLAAATGGEITVQAVLQLLGAVEEEALFRLCDLVVDADTAGALTFVEELSEQGQDISRLVTDLLEHLRHLMLVQHMGEVPETLPVTEETREQLRAQANQLGEATVLRLCDLLAVAVDDMRQGGDPRLPLELALVKVTRPGADLSQESLAYRLELLERREHATSGGAVATHVQAQPKAEDEAEDPSPEPEPPSLELGQLQEVWQRSVLSAVEQRAVHARPVFGEAHPAALDGDTLTLEFPPTAAFHRKLAEEKYDGLVRDALYEVTGRRLGVVFTLGEATEEHEAEDGAPPSEEELVALLKETFDAREVND
jgi:DNA polymerase III gamma/tau subunit